MNKFWILLIVLFFGFSLTGCFGESYDFTPPIVSVINPLDSQPVELKEANIDWRGENNKQIKKETKDILSLAKKQQPMYFVAGEKVDLLFEHTDFLTKELSVSAWKKDKKVDLKVEDISFYLPKEKGEYGIEVNLQTDSGNAQYVGKVTIVK